MIGYTPVKMRVIVVIHLSKCVSLNYKFVMHSVYKQQRAVHMFLGLSFLLKGMIFEWLIFLLIG